MTDYQITASTQRQEQPAVDGTNGMHRVLNTHHKPRMGHLLFDRKDGRWYAFYTDCGSRIQFFDKPQRGAWLFGPVSDDGIHFQKDFKPVQPGFDSDILYNIQSYDISSYDRTGGNDDGFRGTYSQLYVQDNGEHVIFGEDGPGCIYHFWFTGDDQRLHWDKLRC
jgi:hypothetical protein